MKIAKGATPISASMDTKNPPPQSRDARSAPAMPVMSLLPYICPSRPAVKKATVLVSEWFSMWKSAASVPTAIPAPC